MKDLNFTDGLQSLFLSRSSVCGRLAVWADAAGAGVGLGEGVFSLEAERDQERDL